MNLPELCEPLFQQICLLNRSVRKGGSYELTRVRGEILATFEQMRSAARAEPRLIDQYERVELPLIFFVDFMVKESDLPFAREWKELAFDRKELAGDEKFFDLLDETLADPSEAASERLVIFYLCMGLGFTGIYMGQPEYLRKKMMQCSARVSRWVDSDETVGVCPEAYEHVDTRDLVEPPGKKLLGVGIVLVGLILALFATNIYLWHWASRDLTGALDQILQHGRSFLP